MAVADYIYHLLMRKSSTESALMVLFTIGLQAKLPLGTKKKLKNPEFPIPVSFIMGDNDWVRFCDEDKGQECVEARVANHDDAVPKHMKGNYHFCPSSGHNM